MSGEGVTLKACFYAVALAGGLTLVSMPLYLSYAKRLGWGQEIRPEGPREHQLKKGTPTMGGLVLLFAAFCGSLWGPVTPEWGALWGVIWGCALLGMVDDLTSIFKKRNLGLKARHKLLVQGTVGMGLGIFLAWYDYFQPTSTINVGYTLFLSVLVVVSTTNAVNLTDGLDGLAAGTVFFALLGLAFMDWYQGGGLLVSVLALAAACLGFLWYNCYPAAVFMGDTGSLGLGGALAALALLEGKEFWLLLLGGVFVMEALSVIIQVIYFKVTGGKRVFRMSPLHHHFVLGGMHEVKVTVRFCLVSLVLLGVTIFLMLYGSIW